MTARLEECNRILGQLEEETKRLKGEIADMIAEQTMKPPAKQVDEEDLQDFRREGMTMLELFRLASAEYASEHAEEVAHAKRKIEAKRAREILIPQLIEHYKKCEAIDYANALKFAVMQSISKGGAREAKIGWSVETDAEVYMVKIWSRHMLQLVWREAILDKITGKILEKRMRSDIYRWIPERYNFDFTEDEIKIDYNYDSNIVDHMSDVFEYLQDLLKREGLSVEKDTSIYSTSSSLIITW